MRLQSYEIIHEDSSIVVVSKRGGVLSVADRYDAALPNVFGYLKNRFGELYIVHRLDRETSGVICFARTPEAHRDLSLQFENRQVSKNYLALVQGTLANDEGLIDQPIAMATGMNKMIISGHGKPSETRYRVVERYREFTLVAVELLTGRTHQIRVHFQYIGHPLAVDPLYGGLDAIFVSKIKKRRYHLAENIKEMPILNRCSLHASSLEITHPVTGKRISFTSDLPKDLKATLQQLRKWQTLKTN